MIKFVPLHENNNTGTIASFRANIPAIAEKKICSNLNNKDIKTRCDLHPDIDSIVSVDMEDKVEFSVVSVCCEEFRPKLERFLSSQ